MPPRKAFSFALHIIVSIFFNGAIVTLMFSYNGGHFGVPPECSEHIKKIDNLVIVAQTAAIISNTWDFFGPTND